MALSRILELKREAVQAKNQASSQPSESRSTVRTPASPSGNGTNQTQNTSENVAAIKLKNLRERFSIKNAPKRDNYDVGIPLYQLSGKWYKGDQPTYSEALARISYGAKTNRSEASEAYQLLQQSRYDPTSIFYNPYAKSTNRAVEELAKYGIDTSNIDDKWFNDYSWLKQYYNPSNYTNNPSAPTKKSSDQERAGYWYYQLELARDATKAAQDQWKSVQDDIAYWVSRDDLNLSDDEIVNRVYADIASNGKYKDLYKMDETRKSGNPVELNSAIGYSKDAIYGAIWAARNGGGTGNAEADMVNYVMGNGNRWKNNPNISKYTTPGKSYAPWVVGSTMDNECRTLGVTGVDRKWLEEHHDEIENNGTEEEKKAYNAFVDAEEFTEKAEAEAEKLWEALRKKIEDGKSTEKEVQDWLNKRLEDTERFGNLIKLDSSLKKVGKKVLIDTTRAINFSRYDMEQYIHDQFAKKGDKTDDDFTASFNPPATGTAETPEAAEEPGTASGTAGTTAGGAAPAGGVAPAGGTAAVGGPAGTANTGPNAINYGAIEGGKTTNGDQVAVPTETKNVEEYEQNNGKTPVKTLDELNAEADAIILQQQGEKFPAPQPTPTGNIGRFRPDQIIASAGGTFSRGAGAKEESEQVQEERRRQAYDDVHGVGAWERAKAAAANAEQEAEENAQAAQEPVNTPSPEQPQPTNTPSTDNLEATPTQAPRQKTGQQLTEDSQNATVSAAVDALGDYMSLTEKKYFDDFQDAKFDRIRENMLQGPLNPALWEDPNFAKYNFERAARKAEDDYVTTALDSMAFRAEYENEQQQAQALQNKVDAIQNVYGDMLYALEEVKEQQEVTFPNGTTFRLEWDPEKKKYDTIEAEDIEYSPVLAELAAIYGQDTVLSTIQETADRANEHAEKIISAKDKYGTRLEEMRDENGNLSESIPSLREYNELQEELYRRQNWLYENQEKYEQALSDLNAANTRRARVNEMTFRNGYDAINPMVNDTLLDYAKNFAGYTNPEPTGDNPMATRLHYNEDMILDRDYADPEYRAEKIPETVKGWIDENSEYIKDAENLLSVYGDKLPADYAAGIQSYVDYLSAQNRQYDYYLFSRDEKYSDYVSKGNELIIDFAEKNGLDMFYFMDDYEKDMTKALLARDGEDVALGYYNEIMPEVKARTDRIIAENGDEIAQSGFAGRILNTAVGIGLAPVEVVTSILNLGRSAITGETSYVLNLPGNISKTAYSSTVKELDNIYGDSIKGKVIKGLYEIAYNRGRSAMVATTFGGLFPEGTSEVFQAMPIAATAMNEAVSEALDADVDPWKAWTIGAVTFAMEAFTEGIEFKHMKEAFGAGKGITTSAMAEFIRSYLPNAASEVLGESITDVAEKAVSLLAGKEGEIQKLIDSYEKAGYTDQEAIWEAIQDQIDDVMHTAVISFFSPAADVVALASGYVQRHHADAQVARNVRNLTGDRTITARSIRKGEVESIRRGQQQELNRELKPITARDQVTGPNIPLVAPSIGPEGMSEEDLQNQRKDYDTDMTVLELARGESRTSVNATLSGVLRVGADQAARANATIENLDTITGGQDKIDFMEDILTGGLVADVNRNTLMLGVQYASLATGACRQAVMSQTFQNADPETKAKMLAESVAKDAASEATQKQVGDSIHQYRVNEQIASLLMSGAAEDAVKAQEMIEAAERETTAAEEALDAKKEATQVAKDAVTRANDVLQNDSVQGSNDMSSALKDLQGAVQVEAEYNQALENQQQDEQRIKDSNKRIMEKTMAKVRQDAEDAVTQQEAAEAEARAKAEAEAEQKRKELEARDLEETEKRNADRMGAEAFMEAENYTGETEEDKEKIRQMYEEERQRFEEEQAAAAAEAEAAGEVPATPNGFDENDRRVKAIRQIAKRFGADIVFEDMGADGPEGFNPVGTNEIHLNTNLSMDQMFKRVFIHELVHYTEQTGKEYYGQLKDTLIRMKFGENRGQFDASADAITRLYNNRLAAMARENPNFKYTEYTKTDGESEIIANTMAELIGGNEELINRFYEADTTKDKSVVRRFVDMIKSLIKKAEGFEGVSMRQAQKTVELFEQALAKAQQDQQPATPLSDEQVEAIAKEYEGTPIGEAVKSPVKKFSITAPVEMREDGLMAVHNLSMENLVGNFRKGGFASPSIAVVPTSRNWSMYGNVSIFFGANTIDPKRGNTLYAGDAFTPTLGSGTYNTAQEALEAQRQQPARRIEVDENMREMSRMLDSYKKIRSIDEARTKAYSKNNYVAPVWKHTEAAKNLVAEHVLRESGLDPSDPSFPQEAFEALDEMKSHAEYGMFLAIEEAEAKESLSDDDLREILTRNINEAAQELDPEFEGFDFGNDDALFNEFKELYNYVEENPIQSGMQESKPDRIIGLDEIECVEIPADAPQDLVDELRQYLPEEKIHVYDPMTLGDRARVANEIKATVPGVKFSLGEEALGIGKPLQDNQGNDTAAEEFRGGTVSVDPIKYSLNSFTRAEQMRTRKALLDARDEDGKRLYTPAQVDQYLKNALGIASIIAMDKGRLDFKANSAQNFLKPNNDYHFTLDASTLCAKRLLYQGTFDYVQHALPDEVFTPEDLIDLVNIMSQMGYETPCGICYVESRRRWLDTYANEFIKTIKKDPATFVEKRFKKSSSEEKAALLERLSGEMPAIEDLTTSDGLEKLRNSDPLMHKAFVAAMNAKGTANPKVVQLRTEYRGDIAKLTAKDIQKVKDIGGLRIQSFSDFETPHLLDMVQAVMDMSAVGLTSQAYTKVPNFAWVFGDTGIKINLSLIGKGTGLDDNGNLIFDNKEGMNFDEAMRLRDRYSKNVGTILVGINDDHIIAAMGDPRIDFIIPFHKSGWSDKEMQGIPSLQYYKDYTDSQNEKKLFGKDENGNWIRNSDGSYKTIPGKESKLKNFEPVGAHKYWEFDKSGEWNSRKYLQMCADDGRIPKFSQFLVDNGDGSFSLPEGDDKRSKSIREGYWKTLIDFKMYDNEGKRADQTAVTPNINMDQARRVLGEYSLKRPSGNPDTKMVDMKSNNDVPVATTAGDEFIRLIKEKRAGKKPDLPPNKPLEAVPEIDVLQQARTRFDMGDTDDFVPNATTAASAAMASGSNPVLGNTETAPQEAQAQGQQAMAVDPETGETVERKWSLPWRDVDTSDWKTFHTENGTMYSRDQNGVKTELTGVDREYVEAWQNSDFQRMEEILADKIREKGAIPFKTPNTYASPDHRWVANAIKKNDMQAIRQAAAEMAEMVPDNAVLVPMPNHHGRVDESTDTVLLAEEISKITGRPVVPALAGIERESRKNDKSKSKKKQMKVEDLGFYKAQELPEGTVPYIVDNVVASGLTAEAAHRALGNNGVTLAYAKSTLSANDGLKRANVTFYDTNKQYGNYLIPLSERIDMDKTGYAGVKYSIPSDVPYMAAVERGEMDQAQEMVDEKAKEAGYIKAGYHGTLNGGFTVFDKAHAGIGGNSGAGFYFSSNPSDSEANYSDVEGADNWFKANHLADQILDEFRDSDEEDFEYEGYEITEGMPYEDVVEIAKKILKKNPQTYHVYLDQGKPYIRDFNNSTNLLEGALENFDESLYDPADYDSEDDYQEALYDARSDEIYTAISDAVYNGVSDVERHYEYVSDVDYEGIISKLAEIAMDYESLTWNDLIKVLEDQYIDITADGMEESADGSHEIARSIVEAFGYDSIEDREVSKKFNQLKNMGNTGDTVHYIMFHPEQIKLADPVTYDDDGNVIPLSVRFQTANPDIRYSLPTEDVLRRQIREYIKNGGSLSTNTTSPGENLPGPVGPIPQGSRQRQFGSKTAQESDALHDEVKQYLFRHSRYTPETNREQIDRAVDWVQSKARASDPDGYFAALDEVTSENFDYRSADGQARMLTVMSMAALKAESGDPNALNDELRLADAYNKQGTDLGRALQSRKIFRMMTPIGRVSYFQKQVDRLNQDIARRTGKTGTIHLDEGTIRDIGAAETEEDFYRVRKAVAKKIGEQIPANWKDKLRSWRMLAMLGAPRTHGRNFVGNALFIPAVSIKNKLGAVAELSLEKGNRTKTLTPILPRDIRNFARQDAVDMKDELTGEAKYNEETLIDQNRRQFKGLIQVLSDFNSRALEAEDWFFLKGHYRRALGGWIQANGYTVEQMQNDPDLLDVGREYAIREAQKATYRDFNGLAQRLNQLTRNPQTTGQKVLAFGVEAVLPFKKTPANILKRGLEYSPVGIARSLTTDLYHLKQYQDYKNGKLDTLPEHAISPNQFIDNVCSGLTGTAIMALGAILSNMGVVSCGLDDDDDEFEKLRGNQEYSIKFKIGGQDVTFTMDWAAPMCMPFFVGAAVKEQLSSQSGFSIDDMVNAVGNITEPVFNLSMLDGVNSLLDMFTAGDDTNATITQLAAKVASNYVTSYIPSLIGATARTIDTTRRKAFVESGKGSGIMGTLRYAREQTENKIPGLSQTNIPYRDVWGNPDESGPAERILENFVLPGYINDYNDDPVVAELERIGVVPKEPGKTFSADGNKYVLTAEQWDAYKVERGQTAYEMLTELMGSEAYLKANDDERAALVKDVWDYANDRGKIAAIPDAKVDDWIRTSTDPVGDIIASADAKKQKKRISANKENMIISLKNGNFEGYEAMVEALHQDGVTDKAIKDKIADTYRDQYKAAYLKEDYDQMDALEKLLEATGFEFDFKKWRKDANSLETDTEERELYMNNGNGSGAQTSIPRRPASESNWDQYMADLDDYWANYDFSQNDPAGRYGRGNIDLNNRQVVHNEDGSISTEYSFSFYDEDTGKEVLIPQVVNGRIVSEEEAKEHYYETGEHLGMFDDWKEADEYSMMLHNRNNWFYNR